MSMVNANVSTWKDIVDVAAGGTWDHGWTVGLQQNGTVVATGNNEYGQCDVSAWTNIVAVIAGGEFEKRTFGLRSDGSVVFTGEAYEDYNTIYEWRDIVALTATCGVVGLKSDGTVVGTGYIGAQIERDGWTAITEIASYEDWVMGIKANGSLISAIIYTDDSTIMMPSQDIVSCVYFGHREIDGESRDVLVGLKRDGTVVTFDEYGKTINAGLDDSIWKDIRVPESQHATKIAEAEQSSTSISVPTAVPTPESSEERAPTIPLSEDPNALREPTADMIVGAAEGKLIKSGVNLRQGPSTATTILATGLKSGTMVTVYAEDGDFYFLQVNETNIYGYIAKSYVKLLSVLGETSTGNDQPKGTVRGTISSSNLALREGPGVTYQSLGRYYEGKLVYIFYQEGDYYYVQVAGTELKGYMSAQFIKAEGEVSVKGS